MNNIDFIRSALPETEVLAQLAEECGELVQAALKLRRAMKPDGSPTPCNVSEALRRFYEETADVLVCLKVTNTLWESTSVPTVEIIMREKIARWAYRLGQRRSDK